MDDDIMHLALVDEEALLLDAAALELAALDRPEVELEPYVDLLGEITTRLATVGGDARTNAERAAVLADVIGGEYGFMGDAETYDDPDNADLIRVIDRRRGLPVSLAILYVAAARRLSWSADPLNTPGHVLVRIGTEIAPVLIDPFRGGSVVSAAALAAIVAGAPSAADIAPMSNRAVLTRLLLNQASRAETAGDAHRALVLFARMTIVAPANPDAWWNLARLQLRAGDPAGARASLSGMLEMTRDPALRARVSEALARLAGAGE